MTTKPVPPISLTFNPPFGRGLLVMLMLTSAVMACGDGADGLPKTEPYDLPSLDEVCEGVVSGQDVLDAVADEYVALFTYTSDSRVTDLTLTFSYEDGRIVCHPPEPAPPGSLAPDIAAFIEVDITLGIDSADGAFAESIITPLSSFGPGLPINFAARFAVESLAGSYTPVLSDLTNHGLAFAGTISNGTSGSAFEGGTQSNGVGASQAVAAWTMPLQECGTAECDPATEVCVVIGPVGPSYDYSCETVPQACLADRTCDCLEAEVCPPTTTQFCSDAGDNEITCDNGTQ